MRINVSLARILLATTCLMGGAFIGATAFVMASQDKTPKAKPAEGKKAAKTVDVHCKVLTDKGEPLSSGDVVVSLEEACWRETAPDPMQTIGETGEVTFSKLPACFATIIIKVDGYAFVEMEVNGKKQTTRIVDLKEYKTPIVITMKKL